METDYTYDLATPLRYSKDGDFEETGTLTFTKPGMSVYDELQVLSQQTMKALKQASSQRDEEDESEGGDEHDIDSNAIRMVMMLSSVNISDVKNTFIKIAVKTCEVDAGLKVKKDNFFKMDPDEFNDCMFGYIANFIVPSLVSAGE